VSNFTINDCHAIAETAHHGQVDKAGEPYILHPNRVALLAFRKANELRLPDRDCMHCYMAGLLHDVIEDTPVTAETLRKLDVPERVIEIVVLVTRYPDDKARMTYMQWIESIVASSNVKAIVVKWADNADNSSPSRMAALPQEERGITRRYERAKAILDAAILDYRRKRLPV
jgi:(p)ppGpp synthase/HD superfamily hydrolase